MTPGRRILGTFTRFQAAGFAQRNLFLGIILLATPLRQVMTRGERLTDA